MSGVVPVVPGFSRAPESCADRPPAPARAESGYGARQYHQRMAATAATHSIPWDWYEANWKVCVENYFFAPGTDESWIAELLELDDRVGAEDRVLVERVQAGVRSGVLPDGYLLPESERLIDHFERLLVDALGRDDSGTI